MTESSDPSFSSSRPFLAEARTAFAAMESDPEAFILEYIHKKGTVGLYTETKSQHSRELQIGQFEPQDVREILDLIETGVCERSAYTAACGNITAEDVIDGREGQKIAALMKEFARVDLHLLDPSGRDSSADMADRLRRAGAGVFLAVARLQLNVLEFSPDLNILSDIDAHIECLRGHLWEAEADFGPEDHSQRKAINDIKSTLELVTKEAHFRAAQCKTRALEDATILPHSKKISRFPGEIAEHLRKAECPQDEIDRWGADVRLRLKIAHIHAARHALRCLSGELGRPSNFESVKHQVTEIHKHLEEAGADARALYPMDNFSVDEAENAIQKIRAVALKDCGDCALDFLQRSGRNLNAQFANELRAIFREAASILGGNVADLETRERRIDMLLSLPPRDNPQP